MKNYQDSETGQLWAFEDDFDVQKSNNRNIPKTLTEDIKEKPSEEYFWYNSEWVHKNDLPQNYQEPISRAPIYNPAWITFLFPVGYFICPDNKEPLDISLEQINSNNYKGSMFQEVVTTIELENSELKALISYDGALAIPMCSAFPNASIALDTINKIEGALFLGGLILNTTNQKSLECGNLSENDQKINSYFNSVHYCFRSKSASISERIILSSPKYIKVSKLQTSLETGLEVLAKIDNISPNFIVKGYNALLAWALADALSNLWISVEQLTSYIWEKQFLSNIKSFDNTMQNKNRKENMSKLMLKVAHNIATKHKILVEMDYISSSELEVLDLARKQRNGLAHSGTLPKFEVVEKLWFTLLSLLEKYSNVALSELRSRTSAGEGKFNKYYPPGFTNKCDINRAEFPEWPKKKEM